jgi:hypothetical protein
MDLLRQFVVPLIWETWERAEIDTIKKLNACAIPWKHAARHIYENGGTYNFGPGTCKKKWIEMSGIATD